MAAILVNAFRYSRPFVDGIKARISSERGQGIIEYVVLAGFIGLVAAVALAILATNGAFDNMADTISNCVQFDTPCP